MNYRTWKEKWEAEHHLMGGEVKYRSPELRKFFPDSFVFGNDYAYYKALVMHPNMTLCSDIPPTASFVVYLNGDDGKILTDEAPRWSFGDPNISGLGWFGIELGNFAVPEVAPGDSFTVIFTCYNNELGYAQGTLTDCVPAIPFPPGFPPTLFLEGNDLSEPPNELNLHRINGANKICWKQKPGLSYTIYRRNLNDTLALHFPRMQYQKIASGIIDSLYLDTSIDTSEAYGYILFSRNEQNGRISGRSVEVREEIVLPDLRAVFVQPELYNGIQEKLFELVQDWEVEGALVVVYAMQFPTPQALRDTLKSLMGLRGVLLIGNFPVPWYQFCEPNGDNYQEYPCDLYFMDLDGIWEDNYHYVTGTGLVPGADGIYDTHYAHYPRSTEKPEIVVGRIMPTPGMGSAIGVINFYLDKCHRYRHDLGNVRQDFRALAYPDDDWHDWGHTLAENYLSLIYPEFTCIWNINQTTATDYRQRLDDQYSLLHVWVHSWSQGHSFKINNGNNWEAFFNYEILPANANANFYHLFACGNSRYVEDMNCAAIYALQTQAGINTIGSTHSGGMLHYDYFYEQLSEGISFGEAFLRTFQYVGESGFTDEMRGWYYGLTFNGDPFIIPQPPGLMAIHSRNAQNIPVKLQLVNFPNPFNNNTIIQYKAAGGEPIRVEIFDLAGQRVWEFYDERKANDFGYIEWNGTGSSGQPVAGGVYFCKLTASNGQFLVRKMVFLK